MNQRSGTVQTLSRPAGASAVRSIAERVLSVLSEVTGVAEVRQELELRLYQEHMLDSLGTVSLIVAFTDEFGVEIPPSEIDQELWATPRRIVAFMEARLGT